MCRHTARNFFFDLAVAGQEITLHYRQVNKDMSFKEYWLPIGRTLFTDEIYDGFQGHIGKFILIHGYS